LPTYVPPGSVLGGLGDLIGKLTAGGAGPQVTSDGARRPGTRSVVVDGRGPRLVTLLRDGREASTPQELSNRCGRALTNDRSTSTPAVRSTSIPIVR